MILQRCKAIWIQQKFTFFFPFRRWHFTFRWEKTPVEFSHLLTIILISFINDPCCWSSLISCPLRHSPCLFSLLLLIQSSLLSPHFFLWSGHPLSKSGKLSLDSIALPSTFHSSLNLRTSTCACYRPHLLLKHLSASSMWLFYSWSFTAFSQSPMTCLP